MSQSIKQRLESSLSTAAPSGRAIASYMLANLYELPFQTAADIASKLGVSESSVGRFCRALGYSHFKELKNDLKDDLVVPAIHDEPGYRIIRETLAAQYNLGNREPNVQIWSIDRRGDRSLTLRHQQHDRKPLGDSTDEVLKHLHRLWGFDIHLETLQGDQVMKVHHVPPKGEHGDADYGRLDLSAIHL